MFIYLKNGRAKENNDIVLLDGLKLQYNAAHAPVAQLDRVLGYEPRGRAFESLRAHQIPALKIKAYRG